MAFIIELINDFLNWCHNLFKPKSKKKVKTKPSQFYHGTNMNNALEIYKSDLWMIGDSSIDDNGKGIYMSDDFDEAKDYAGKKGGILILNVSPSVNLTFHKKNIYSITVPGSAPYKEYYKVKGLNIKGLLDYYGNKIH